MDRMVIGLEYPAKEVECRLCGFRWPSVCRDPGEAGVCRLCGWNERVVSCA